MNQMVFRQKTELYQHQAELCCFFRLAILESWCRRGKIEKSGKKNAPKRDCLILKGFEKCITK